MAEPYFYDESQSTIQQSTMVLKLKVILRQGNAITCKISKYTESQMRL